MSSKVTAYELGAAERFFQSALVPLLLEANDLTVLRGTGTLFKFLNRHFLVTAAHVFDNVDAEDIGIPTTPNGPKIVTLGPGTLYRTLDQLFDAAIYELRNSETISELQSWRFLERDNIAPAEPSGVFAVAGFPSSQSATGPTAISCKPLTVFTKRIPIPHDAVQPVDDHVDIFLEYARSAELFGKGVKPTPELEGVSGASVWQVASGPQNGLVWAPERKLRVVGIQAAFRHSKYIRAKSWSAIGTLFGNVDQSIGRFVQEVVRYET